MRYLKLFLCVLFVGTVLPMTPLSAAPLKLLGPDDVSCKGWKKQNDPELREAYIQWVRGFLSGHNYANQSRQVTDVSKATVAMFIDRYCLEYPSATVSEAAMRMSDRYSGRNVPITR